ncbi:hypothetical protein BH24ACT15_BH24ACT15_21540 [soil metagenome]
MSERLAALLPPWSAALSCIDRMGMAAPTYAMIMLMATLTRRLQVLLEEDRFARLDHIAKQRRTTVAALVRDALDRVYSSDTLPPDVAADRFLAREPLDLGEWDQAKRDIEDSLLRGKL